MPRRPVLTIAVLIGLAAPSAAFWIERVLEGKVWYLRNPGPLGALVGALSPPFILMPVLFVAQLIVLVQGWRELTVRQRLVAVVLVAAPVPALLLPLLLRFAF